MGSSQPKAPPHPIDCYSFKNCKIVLIYYQVRMPLHSPKRNVSASPARPPHAFARVCREAPGGSGGAAFFLSPREPAAASVRARFFPALEAAGSVTKPRAPSG